MDAKDLGERMKARRLYIRLSQADVAARIPVPTNTYNRWETGVNTVPTVELPNVAKALGISVSWLFSDDDQTVADDSEVAMYWNGIAPELKPAAKASLRALYEANRREDEAGTIGGGGHRHLLTPADKASGLYNNQQGELVDSLEEGGW